jgi:hypothetical protein
MGLKIHKAASNRSKSLAQRLLPKMTIVTAHYRENGNTHIHLNYMLAFHPFIAIIY